MTLPEEILINLAANLAAELITRAGGRLRDLAFGDAETRALGRAWQRAFQAMLQAVAADLSADDANLLADIWREFVAAEGVAGGLLDLALAGDDPPLPTLRARFDALDFDRATLAVDFDAALAALTRGLDAALLDEAEQPGSPLYNRVSLRRLAAIHQLLRRDAPPYRPGVPFQAPTVPRYFVPRPEVSAALMAYLATDAPHGALVVSAVHGLGGIGKTTLVAALAREPAVEARFPDGVLWATLGQTPDALSLLAGWIQALGDYDFRPTVADSASSHLRTLLHDKACLLVVDDAWDAGHARPFLVGESRCRLVVTTRDAALARKVGAQLYDLDVMSEAQALALFEARLGPLGDDRQAAAALACELGYLPLALELAAAQVEAGCTWVELLNAFRQAIVDLSVLDLDEASYHNESLRISFGLSLDGLPPDGRGGLPPDDRDAFAWLGVLPEDVYLNSAMAATLWEISGTSALERLRLLRDRALLKQVDKFNYTLHNLLHDEAKLRLTEQFALPEGHAWLLGHYRRKVPYDQWHRLPDDRYVHERLTWHLEQAGQPEAIHALLRLETEEKRNAWYEAREALGQTAGYLDDVRRAWRLATLTPPPGPLPSPGQERGGGGGDSRRGWGEVIGLQCRYALVVASLNSLAGSLPPALIAALVKEKVWTPAQGLAHVHQMPDPKPRAIALAELAVHLPEPLKRQALQESLTAVQMIKGERSRAETLIGLLSHLPETLLCETLAVAREIKDEETRMEVLAELIAHLPEPLKGQLLRKALATARMIGGPMTRAKALTKLIPHLPEPLKSEALEESLSAASWISQESFAAAKKFRSRPTSVRWLLASPSVEVLAGLMSHLSEPLKSRVLRWVWVETRLLRWLSNWVGAMAWLAYHLPESIRDEFWKELVMMAQDDVWKWRQASALANLAYHLPVSRKDKILREALSVVQKMGSEFSQALTLTELARCLPESLLQQAIKITQQMKDEDNQIMVLIELSSHMPEPIFGEVLAAVRGLGDGYSRSEAISGLAPYLPESLLRETWTMIQEIEGEWKRDEAIAGLAPRLAELGYLEEALAVVREIRWSRYRAETLVRLIPHLPESLKDEVLREALEAVSKLTYGESDVLSRRTETLARLVPKLPSYLLRKTLDVARRIGDEYNRAKVILALTPCLPELLKDKAVQEALAAVQKIDSEQQQVEILAEMAPHLSASLLQETLEMAQRILVGDCRARALTVLIPHLQDPLKSEILRKALMTVCEIDNEWQLQKAKALAELAPHLPGSLLQEAWAMVRRMQDENSRAKALSGLAPCLPESSLQEAMAIVRRMQNENNRAEALSRLVSYLPESSLQEAMAMTRRIQDDCERAKVLTRLAPRLSEAMVVVWEIKDRDAYMYALVELASQLPEPMKIKMLQEALMEIQKTKNEQKLPQILARLVPYLKGALLREILAATWKVTNIGIRAEALAELVPYLPATLKDVALQETLVAVREIENKRQRAKVLTKLALHLAELPVETLLPMWQETLPVLAARTRQDLLSDLGALAPVIHALGGQAAIEETFRAVQEVGRWWE